MSSFKRKTEVTLYDDLGLLPSASAVEVRERFLMLAHASDPDRSSPESSLERFKKVIAAYYVLRDPQRRSRYDAYLATQMSFDPFLSESPSLASNSESDPGFTAQSRMKRPDTTYRFTFERKSKRSRETSNESIPETHATEPTASDDAASRPDAEGPSTPSPAGSTFQVPFSRNSNTTYRRSKRGLPWVAALAQLLAIVFGAACAVALAHFALLWIEPASGGLTRFLK